MRFSKKQLFLLGLSSFLLFSNFTPPKKTIHKPRIIITADPELDDSNSLIRFLLYSSDVTIEGLIYTSSQFHWKGDGKGTKFMVPGREYTRYGLNLCPCESYRWKKGEKFIHEIVDAYEKVYKNLKIHDTSYPKPDELKSKIKYGNTEFEGDFSKNTEGSDLIKTVILDNKPGPVFITAWGGQSTIARALKSIEEEYKNTPQWESMKKKVSRKVILLPSGEQDNTYQTYIKPNWPDIDYRQYKNGPNYGYGAQLVAAPESAPFLTDSWMHENINSKGPLGERYRVWGDGKQMVEGDRFDYFGFDGYTNEQLKKMGYIVWMPVQKKGSWLGEGDTGTFMNILPNGLNADEKDNPGGWGGRLFLPNPKTYVDPFSSDTTKNKDLVISSATLNRLSASEEELAPFPNFFPAAQNDFAARLKWSVNSNYKSANHAPIVEIKGENELYVSPGEKVELKGVVSEPDGDSYLIKWWQFSKNKKTPTLLLSNSNSLKPTIEIPKNAQTDQPLFLVLEVADNGSPQLTSYQTIKLHLKN